jgi:ATP-dependent DNA helicase DinG
LPFEFRAAVLKGRSNYLCQRRLAALRQTGVSTPEEMRMLAKVLVWLPSTQTGSGASCSCPTLEQAPVGQDLGRERYLHRRALPPPGAGSLLLLPRAAGCERAHLVIVNHALLLSDVAVDRWGGRVLPEYRYLIVDEAHHLENSVTRQLSFEGDQWTVERTLNELARPLGVRRYAGHLADVLLRCRGALPPEPWACPRGPRGANPEAHRGSAVTGVCLLSPS